MLHSFWDLLVVKKPDCPSYLLVERINEKSFCSRQNRLVVVPRLDSCGRLVLSLLVKANQCVYR